MNRNEYELAQAESEANFGRNFILRSEARYGKVVEPRAYEAMVKAEQRYSDAIAGSGVDQIDKAKIHTGKCTSIAGGAE